MYLIISNSSLAHIEESKSFQKSIEKVGHKSILFITDKGLMSLNLTEPTLNELSKYSSTVEVFQDVEADPSIKTLYSSIEAGKKIETDIYKPVWQFDSKWTCIKNSNN